MSVRSRRSDTDHTPSGSRLRIPALCGDERARIPFALIGVLLLVTSSAYAAGLADQGLVSEDRSAERAVDRVDADATAALRAAAREAAHDAAADPVTRAPSGTGPAASVVREGSAFADAFRIRLAIAGADALTDVETEIGDTTATVSLPPVDEPGDLREARDRVRVEPAANGTATRVTFEAVETAATRDGRTMVQRTESRTVVVAVPTLAAHERTERFQTRLNRGPVEGAGLGRQITASLYPMTWARGYAQYAGAPVENVLGNRHVELATNAGIVRTQRDVFGASDPDARGGLARATARTGVTDLLEPTGVDEESWTETVLDAPAPTDGATTGTDGRIDESVGEVEDGDRRAFEPETDRTAEETTVPIGHAADVGAARIHDDLDAITEGAYRVESTVETSTTQAHDGGRPIPKAPESAPGAEWERVELSHAERISSVSGTERPQRTPSGTVEPGERVSFGAAEREVSVRRVATAEWRREVVERGPNGTAVNVTVHRTTTRDAVTDRYRVRASVSGRHAPTDDAPDRPTATFGAGGAGGEADLQETPESARSDLAVDTRAGVDQIARDAVRDGDVRRSVTVYGARSDTERDRIAADVAALAADVREVETAQSMEDASVGEAEPYADLAETLRDRRGELVDAPRTYDGATDRARVAARVAYVDAVINELETTAADRDTATDEFLDRVNDAFDGPSVGDAVASREAARDPGTYTLGDDGPGGAVTFAPEGSPGYLPRTAVDGRTVEGVNGTTTRPLATRNVNYATVPYGEVSSGVVDRILGTEDTVRIGTAGRALLLADEALTAEADPDLRADRDALAGRVERSLRAVDRNLEATLADRTDLSRDDRRRALDAAAAAYESTGDRAVAVGDGSYPDRVASEAATGGSLSTAAEASLAAHLRVTTRSAAGGDAVRVPTRFVDEPTSGARMVLRDRMEGAVEDGTAEAGQRAAERWAPKPVRTVGAGMPIAPVPGYWVTTVNAWRVQVRGAYPRFALRADVGTPGEPFEYVREAGSVTVEIDGETVRIGETEPVRFDTETVVMIAVPAGPPGVGDVDGTRDERSGGWPCPGGANGPAATHEACTAS